MHFVLFNGPIGSGKSYFCRELADRLIASGEFAEFRHFKTPIIQHIHDIYEAQTEQKWSGDYESLRNYVFASGKTGRDEMIAYGKYLNETDPNYLSQFLLTSVNILDEKYILVDDCGRMQEYLNVKSGNVGQHTSLVYLENRTIISYPSNYKHGEQFKHDNRTCLRDFSNWSADPDSDTIFNYLVNTGPH